MVRLCVIKCSEHIIKFPTYCDLEPGVIWHKWHGCQVSRAPSGPGERPDNLMSQSHQHTHTHTRMHAGHHGLLWKCIVYLRTSSTFTVFVQGYKCSCTCVSVCILKLVTNEVPKYSILLAKWEHCREVILLARPYDFIGLSDFEHKGVEGVLWALWSVRSDHLWNHLIIIGRVFAEVLRALAPTSSELKTQRLRRETSSRTRPCPADHRDQAWDNNDLEEWEPTQTICIL